MNALTKTVLILALLFTNPVFAAVPTYVVPANSDILIVF